MSAEYVDLECLEKIILEKGGPIHINVLARASARAKLELEAKRLYAPGARYDKDEIIWLNDQIVTVIESRQGGNPKQGKFTVLTLNLPDRKQVYMAAAVPSAPSLDHKTITQEEVIQEVEIRGSEIRNLIQEAMEKDGRFVWFQDEQGDKWCLKKLLPDVGEQEIAQAWQFLRGLVVKGMIYSKPTELILKEIWGQENDGSQDYLLKEFALNVALQHLKETRWLGSGWVLEEEWQEILERLELVGPREPNIIEIPEGVIIEKMDGKEKEEDTEEIEQVEVIEEDFVTWEQKRLRNATITFGAKHYYGNWLPLTKELQRIFPPRASGADMVIFHHRFEGEDKTFQAYVNWDQKQICGSPEMYQVFYKNSIYPGAKLVISHRGNYQDYDIRTKPITKQDKIRVRRISLAIDENGQVYRDEEGYPRIEYEEYDEPRRYEVTDEVFIVGVSWEDREALFAEADRVGQGFFGLMYEVCCEWWEAKGREPLYVTAEELFQEIHYNRRSITSCATIPLELWWRLAFETVGGGRAHV